MFTNIKMNKKQKKKLRADTLKLLETQKSKLNVLTYLSLKNKIEDKRIDAVKRINNELKDIRTSTKTGITKKEIKRVGEEIKSKRAKQLQGLARNLNLRYVKRQSEFSGAGTTNIWNRLKTMNGEVRVSIVDDGNSYFSIHSF